MKDDFLEGFKDGLPIGLGYLSVSFTFGMMAVSAGLPISVAVAISLTNLTSAGQFAGLTLIAQGGTYVEMALTQLIINLRYALMSLSLSQKMDDSIHTSDRMIIAFGVTDEIFALTAQKEGNIRRFYSFGLMILPISCWTLGTLIGACATSLLPLSIRSCLGIAIYGMFLAIFIPPAKKFKPILYVVLISVIFSCCFAYLPVLNKVSSGFVIIICTILSSFIGAVFFPVKEANHE